MVLASRQNNEMNWKKVGMSIWKRTWQTTLILFVLLCILEVSYRYQWIDFFKAEFKALNAKVNPKKPNVLVFGDSFTAHPKGYVDQLRERQASFNFINCAMPGSGPYEMELMAARRITDYPPTCVIYQMYVGNDLTDIQAPTNWNTLTFSRNCYWSGKNYFKILGLFSRRWSGIQSDFDPKTLKQDTAAFSIDRYSPRTKMMIRASANYVQECIALGAEYRDAFEECKASIVYLREIVPKKVPIYIVMIPHFSQVTSAYNQRYEQLSGNKSSTRPIYPFIYKLSRIKGVKVLNPLTYFRDMEAKGVQMYFNNDPHLTDEGQAALADFLEKHLEKEWK